MQRRDILFDTLDEVAVFRSRRVGGKEEMRVTADPTNDVLQGFKFPQAAEDVCG